MSKAFERSTSVVLCFVIASLVYACAKDNVAPVDVEKQAFEDLRVDIREAITDPVREAAAIKLVGVLEQNLADLRASITARKARAHELNANYDTPRAEFESFLAKVETEVRENKQRVSETHRALLSNINSEERSSIAKAHTKAMNAAIQTIQSI